MADFAVNIPVTVKGKEQIPALSKEMQQLGAQATQAAKGAGVLGGASASLADQLHKARVAQHLHVIETGNASPRIAELIQRLQGQATAQAAATAATDAGGMSMGAMTAVAGLLVTAIIAVATALGASVVAATQYEQKLVQIETLTGQTRAQTAEWGKQIADLAPQVGKGPAELADAMYFIASNGKKGAEAMDLLTMSAKASAVGMGETTSVAKALTAITNAYAAEGLTAARATDILLATVREGGAEADQLAGSIGRVAGVAANFGVSMEEVGAFVATFTRVIPSAAEAATSLRQTILNLEAPSDKTRETLHNLGTSVEEVRANIKEKGLMAALAELIDKTKGNYDALRGLLPNVRALAGVMATAGSQGKAYADVLESIKNSHGDMDEAFERTKETAAFQWEQVKAQLQVVAITIGAELLPAVKSILEVALPITQAVQDWVEWFGKLPQPIKDAASAMNMFSTLGRLLDPGKEIRDQAKLIEDEAKSSNLRILAIKATNEEAYLRLVAQRAAKEKKLEQELTEEQKKQAEQRAKSIQKLTQEMQDGTKKLDIMAAALRNVGGVGALSAEQIKKYGTEVEKAARAGAELSEEQKELLHVWMETQWIQKWNDDLAKQREAYEKLNEVAGRTADNLTIDMGRMADAVERTGGVATMSDHDLANFIERMEDMKRSGGDNAYAQQVLAQALKEAASRGVLAGKALKEYEENLKANVEATHELTETTFEWSITLEEAVGLLHALGIVGDESANALVTGFMAGQAAIDFTNEALADGKLSLGEMAGVLTHVVEGFKKATDSASGMARLLGGAAFGAQIGSGIGSLFGPTGQVIGAIGGGLIGGLMGLFRKPSWQKVGEEAGRTLGVSISEELSKTIEKDMKELGLTAAQAALLHITDAATESGRSVSTFSEQLVQLMRGVKDGSIPAKEGVAELSRAFVALKEEGGRAMLEFIQQTRAAGLEIPAVAEHVKAALGQVTSNLAEVFAGIDFTAWEGGATDAAYLFASTFGAVLAEQGLGAAITQLEDAWTHLNNVFENFGTDAAAILGPIPELMALMGEETKPIITGIDAARQVLNGLADSGYMTEGAFVALQNTAQGAYDQLIANGASEQAALLAIAPMLGDLARTADLYGIELDENTKRLIEQAEAAGVAFPADPMLQMIDLLGEIVQLLGGTLPEAARRGAQGVEDAYDGVEINIPVNYNYNHNGNTGINGGDPTEGLPHAAHGFVASPSPSGMPIVVGDRSTTEVVAPVDYLFGNLANKIVSGVSAAVANGGNGGGGEQHFHIYFGNEKFDELIQTRMEAGYIKVPRNAVQG